MVSVSSTPTPVPVATRRIQLLGSFEARDGVIESLFREAEGICVSLDKDSIPISEHYKTAIRLEFRMQKIRSLLNSELATLTKMQNMVEVQSSDVMVRLLRTRHDQVMVYFQRLNETREDIRAIERLFYTMKMGNFTG